MTSTNDILYSKCLPQYFDHEWDRNGTIDREMGDSSHIYDVVEYVCLNCEQRFTELEPAGENRRSYEGSDLD